MGLVTSMTAATALTVGIGFGMALGTGLIVAAHTARSKGQRT